MTQSTSTVLTSSETRQLANAIRFLSMDAVERARSGHPGMPLGMADVATVLFSRFLKFDPSAPRWADRDRFVLSAGHGSMLLYSLLYLTGYEDVDLDQIKAFRQLGSRTAGHPEYGLAAGVETTTGPLGQGIATAVGMALAEKVLRARFGDDLVSHHTYVIAGDGCLMEGISHEAAGLAGRQKLDRLIVLFDDNGITIDGKVELSCIDDQLARFRAHGWDVRRCDGHDPEDVAAAIAAAKESDAPSLIACRTIIGYGAPNKQGTAATHGAPLGADEIAAAREHLNWPHPPFEVPEDILSAWRRIGARGKEARLAWQDRLAAADVPRREGLIDALSGNLPKDFDNHAESYRKRLIAEQPKVATRKASEMAINAYAEKIGNFLGGSADLTGSNLTRASGFKTIEANDADGQYVYYGIREHAMAAAMNGIALHGGLIPFGGTFLVFTDYCRPAIRLSALMKQRVVYVMTHDSIGLGEDGPTHQPVEHLASLRAMPNLLVFRPADAVETAECWALALEARDMPSVLALSRQGLPTLRKDAAGGNLSARGAYVLAEAEGEHRASLFATGSEVEIALAAREELQRQGIGTRVVSVPCMELFAMQDMDYRRDILAPGTVRVAIEAAVGQGWEPFIGAEGAFIGMSSFGESAPAGQLYRHFGITRENIVSTVQEKL